MLAKWLLVSLVRWFSGWCGFMLCWDLGVRFLWFWGFYYLRSVLFACLGFDCW